MFRQRSTERAVGRSAGLFWPKSFGSFGCSPGISAFLPVVLIAYLSVLVVGRSPGDTGPQAELRPRSGRRCRGVARQAGAIRPHVGPEVENLASDLGQVSDGNEILLVF